MRNDAFTRLAPHYEWSGWYDDGFGFKRLDGLRRFLGLSRVDDKVAMDVCLVEIDADGSGNGWLRRLYAFGCDPLPPMFLNVAAPAAFVATVPPANAPSNVGAGG